jgi:hypothetical protein
MLFSSANAFSTLYLVPSSNNILSGFELLNSRVSHIKSKEAAKELSSDWPAGRLHTVVRFGAHFYAQGSILDRVDGGKRP